MKQQEQEQKQNRMKRKEQFTKHIFLTSLGSKCKHNIPL